MSNFWDGISGKSEEAFSKEIVDVLPNGTLATAKIIKATNESGSFGDNIQIQWELVSGEFTGRHLFQKLFIYDQKPERQLKARNMLKYLLDLFQVTVTPDAPPSDHELIRLVGKVAGLKIMEWQMERDNGAIAHGNNISEVHKAEGFLPITGKYREFKAKKLGVDSALTRNNNKQHNELNDDIPF